MPGRAANCQDSGGALKHLAFAQVGLALRGGDHRDSFRPWINASQPNKAQNKSGLAVTRVEPLEARDLMDRVSYEGRNAALKPRVNCGGLQERPGNQARDVPALGSTRPTKPLFAT